MLLYAEYVFFYIRFAADAIQTPELKGNEIQVKVSGALVSSEDIAHVSCFLLRAFSST